LAARTAWAVVPEPAKESSTTDESFVAISNTLSNNPMGFGVSKLVVLSKSGSVPQLLW
jgi:hypothetical protein